MFCSAINAILIYYKFWGLGYQLPNGSIKKWPVDQNCILFFHITALVVNVVLVWNFYDVFFYSRDILGMVYDAIKYDFAVIAYALAIGDSFFKQASLRKFWDILRVIYEKYHCQRYLYRQYLIKFSAFFLLTVTVEANLLPLIINDKQSFKFWAMYIMFLLMGRTRSFQYMFFVEILRQQIAVLSTDAANISTYREKIR